MAYNLTGVKSHVKNAANYFGPKHGIKVVGGWRAVGSVPNSDHPKGLALDFMTRSKSQGDALAADLVSSASAWGITYVIWWRRIWTPAKGWHSYSGPSAHTDHVHASFSSKAGTNGGTGDNTSGSGGGDIVTVGNPLVPDSLEKAIDKLSDPWTLRSVAFYMIGTGLLVLGILLLVVGSLPGAKTAAKVATKVIAK